MRRGFTLAELVAVIIISGILGGILTQTIFNLYQNYAQNKIINRLQGEADSVLEQISRLLGLAVEGKIIAADPNGSGFIQIKDKKEGDKYEILEWLPASYEAMISTDPSKDGGKFIGGYSGLADLEHPSTSASSGEILLFYTPLSDLQTASETMSDLTDKKVTLKNGRAGLFFKGLNPLPNDFTDGVFIATRDNDFVLKISKKDGSKIEEISERYELLHTAYAVSADKESDGGLTLNLHYNYQPWAKSAPNELKNATKTPLAKNVTHFSFNFKDGALSLKICLKAANIAIFKKDAQAILCKSETVYR